MADETPDDEIQISGVWVGVDEVSVVASNQFIGQIVALEEIVMTFGHFVPPALLGSPEERVEQARQLSFVPIQAVARLSMTRARLEQLHGVIQQTLDNHARMVSGGSQLE